MTKYTDEEYAYMMCDHLFSDREHRKRGTMPKVDEPFKTIPTSFYEELLTKRAEHRTLVEVSRKIAEYHAPTAFPSQYPNEDELWKEFLSAIPPSDEQKEGKRDGKNND